jgi:CheY-like chemotaxis protein
MTLTSVIVFFELIPDKSVWSIPVKPEEEHMLAVPGSGGFSGMLIRKQGAEENKAATKEDEYKKQYHRRTRILIIDDEPDITLAFRKALTDKGFKQVETANDPILALKDFKAGSYDLLIIDIVMPEMDGFSLYEEIRKIDNKVKVCFITAFEVNYQALRAVFPAATSTDDIGCFIRKPVDMDDLVKRIQAEIE